MKHLMILLLSAIAANLEKSEPNLEAFSCDNKIEKVAYLGNYPYEKEGDWTHKLQGISYSNGYWYFAQEETLWKVPISGDLDKSKNMYDNRDKFPGLKKVNMPRALKDKCRRDGKSGGYNHFGDMDNFNGYIFVPIEGFCLKYDNNAKTTKKEDLPPIIAVFREDDLAFIDYFVLNKQNRAGWCAINPVTKNLYTSGNFIDGNNPISVYKIDWNQLERNNLSLSFEHEFQIINLPASWGGKVRTYMQGGDFSDDGCFLFLLNGRLREGTKGRGISIYKNTNHKVGLFVMSSVQDGQFEYKFNPGWSKYEEPEGLTYADLRRDRRIKEKGRGNLHAILLDKDIEDLTGGNNAVYIKHYNFQFE